MLKSKFNKPSEIIVTKRNTGTLKHLTEKGVTVTDDNIDDVKNLSRAVGTKLSE